MVALKLKKIWKIRFLPNFDKDLVRGIYAIWKLKFWRSQKRADSKLFSVETNLGMVLWTRVILWNPHERMGYHGCIKIEKIFLPNFGKDLVMGIYAIWKPKFWRSQKCADSKIFSVETNLGMVLWTRVILWSPHVRMGYHGYIEIEENLKNSIFAQFW